MDHVLNVTEKGNFRAKVVQIVTMMRHAGHAAQIYSSLRSKQGQAEKVAQGVSKTLKSNHLAGPDGLCSAVDIADANARPGPWDASKEFWLILGRLALTQGCGWGGLFGLPLGMKIKMLRFMLDRSKTWRSDNWLGKIGWDPAHVEVKPSWLDSLIVKYVERGIK